MDREDIRLGIRNIKNLLSNAIKFTPEQGKVSIQVRCQEDTTVEVSVTDTGIGIKKEHQELIFSEFRQVEESYARRYEGTGLGLALTRRLVELHGGHIWVESEESKGSTFDAFVKSPNQAQIDDHQPRKSLCHSGSI